MRFSLSRMITAASMLQLLAKTTHAFSIYSRRSYQPSFIAHEFPNAHRISSNEERTKFPPLRMANTPMVPWQPIGQEYAQFVDIYSRLMRDRILVIGTFIDEETANSIITTILYLRKEDPNGKISLYLNVPGALMRPALAVYDLLLQVREECELSTLNLGLCSGMGALIAGAGTKGMRSSMPNARYLLQRTGIDRFQGQASDIGLEVSSIKNLNDRMEYELVKMTGQPLSKIQSDLKRDFYLSSDEAVAYGLIDNVLLPDAMKNVKELKYEKDPWTGQKVFIDDDEADLGKFGGTDEQRYQGTENQGGFGSGSNVDDYGRKKDDEDDYEPPTQK